MFSDDTINEALASTDARLRLVEEDRCDPQMPQVLAAMISNFIWVANGEMEDGFLESHLGDYNDHLKWYTALSSACNEPQREAMRGIISRIVSIRNAMSDDLKNKRRHPSRSYEMELTKENRYGRIVVAMAEAFQMDVFAAA